jgi:hypothetical protein
MPYVVLVLMSGWVLYTQLDLFIPYFVVKSVPLAIIPFYKVRGKVENSPFLRNKYQCVSHELSLPICVKNTAVNDLPFLLTFSQVKHFTDIDSQIHHIFFRLISF